MGSSLDPILTLGTVFPNGIGQLAAHMVAPQTPGHLEHPEHPHPEHPEQHMAKDAAGSAAKSDPATVDDDVDSTIEPCIF